MYVRRNGKKVPVEGFKYDELEQWQKILFWFIIAALVLLILGAIGYLVKQKKAPKINHFLPYRRYGMY